MTEKNKSILKELENLGTAQNRKIYSRHGVQEKMFGVSFANLGKLKKRIKTDHDLALELWDSENHDARILALMIADSGQADDKLLDSWVQELGNYVITDAFAKFTGSSLLAIEKMEQWTKSDREWITRAGYMVLAGIAMQDKQLADGFFEEYLILIETDIHQALNRVRDAMNSALIAIGIRNDKLRHLAQAAAERIGTVEVDHGETGCKTPAAIPYIDRAWARKKK